MLHTFVDNKFRILSRITLGIFSTCLLLSASGASTLLLTGCSLCGDEFLEKIPSPDGHFIVESRLRDCGATTAEALNVSVRKNRDFLNQETFVFAAKHDHPLNIDIRWRDNATLEIDCGDCEAKEVYRKDTRAGAVKIDYDLPRLNQGQSIN
jgi:hypothetical protein